MTRRQETTPRSLGIENGLAARVHDPLWLLARQWQFGEFRGEDAASPAFVDIHTELHRLDRWRPAGSEEWQPYVPAREPLEEVVEQERTAVAAPRLRLDGGLRLKRLLQEAGHVDLLGAFVDHCGFPPLASTGTVAAAVRRRTPDGARLAGPLARLADPSMAEVEGAELGLPSDRLRVVADIAVAWLTWWAERAPPNGGDASGGPVAWDGHRLEYAFEVGSTTLADVRLTGAGYTGDGLDWWAVDASTTDERTDDGVEPTVLAQRGVPAPARYGGMPSPRFWEMEDARFDPGSIDAAPSDLGRLLVTTFATVYGNDWFVLPVALPIATLSRMVRFSVTDVFGRTFELGPAGVADDGWNLFGLTDTSQPRSAAGERATSPWFFLAPGLAGTLESAPLETILLLRDEMANLAWAVEAYVSDDSGGLIDRFATATGEGREAPSLAPGAPGRYRVDTVVPDHWYPLAPEPLEDRESVILRLLPLARRVGREVTTLFPLGGLLASARPEFGGELWIHEEEVPRSGAAVRRTHQHVRWHDGSVHRWIGRRKTTGGGEGSSGLRFDAVEPSPE